MFRTSYIIPSDLGTSNMTQMTDTYLLLHQEYLLFLGIDLFVVNQLWRRAQEKAEGYLSST